MECCQTAISTTASVTDIIANPSLNLMDLNIARRLSNMRDTVTSIIRDLSHQYNHQFSCHAQCHAVALDGKRVANLQDSAVSEDLLAEVAIRGLTGVILLLGFNHKRFQLVMHTVHGNVVKLTIMCRVNSLHVYT